MRDTISIYAVKAGTVLYVGQTRDLGQRSRHHAKRFPGAEVVLLRKCGIAEASRIERQIIKSHWRRGQCQGNKTLPRIPLLKFYGSGNRVSCAYAGLTWPSFNAAGRFFGVSGGTISNCLKLHGGRIEKAGVEYLIEQI